MAREYSLGQSFPLSPMLISHFQQRRRALGSYLISRRELDGKWDDLPKPDPHHPVASLSRSIPLYRRESLQYSFACRILSLRLCQHRERQVGKRRRAGSSMLAKPLAGERLFVHMGQRSSFVNSHCLITDYVS
jgi:hypothetical protein